jgi:hypothetical protein
LGSGFSVFAPLGNAFEGAGAEKICWVGTKGKFAGGVKRKKACCRNSWPLTIACHMKIFISKF